MDEGTQKESSSNSETAAQEELNNSINDFVTGYKELVEKHQVDFAQYPVYTPDGNGGFRTVIQNTPVSTKSQPVKSPIIIQS